MSIINYVAEDESRGSSLNRLKRVRKAVSKYVLHSKRLGRLGVFLCQ